MEYVLIGIAAYLISCIIFGYTIYKQDKEVLDNKILYFLICVFWPVVFLIYLAVKNEEDA